MTVEIIFGGKAFLLAIAPIEPAFVFQLMPSIVFSAAVSPLPLTCVPPTLT
jgi:hypothetical protein